MLEERMTIFPRLNWLGLEWTCISYWICMYSLGWHSENYVFLFERIWIFDKTNRLDASKNGRKKRDGSARQLCAVTVCVHFEHERSWCQRFRRLFCQFMLIDSIFLPRFVSMEEDRKIGSTFCLARPNGCFHFRKCRISNASKYLFFSQQTMSRVWIETSEGNKKTESERNRMT